MHANTTAHSPPCRAKAALHNRNSASANTRSPDEWRCGRARSEYGGTGLGGIRRGDGEGAPSLHPCQAWVNETTKDRRPKSKCEVRGKPSPRTSHFDFGLRSCDNPSLRSSQGQVS